MKILLIILASFGLIGILGWILKKLGFDCIIETLEIIAEILTCNSD